MGTKINNAVAWATKIAKDATHGYDQINRWGADYDCSSLVISAYEQAGVKVKTAGATYTANMATAFKKCGFVDVTNKVNFKTGGGLIKGDVLLNHQHHTAMMIDTKNLVQASINEKGTIYGGKTGDQTGREIATRTYYSYPWDCVLRYAKDTVATSTSTTTTAVKSAATIAKEVIAGKWGNGTARKTALIKAGYDYAKVQAEVDRLMSGTTLSVGDKVKITGNYACASSVNIAPFNGKTGSTCYIVKIYTGRNYPYQLGITKGITTSANTIGFANKNSIKKC